MAGLNKEYNFLSTLNTRALDDVNKQLVAEACIGYFILNQPPDELVQVVRKVSNVLLGLVKKTDTEMTDDLLKYVASVTGEYFGVLPEGPTKGSNEQLCRALQSDDSTVPGVPGLAIHLNAHRTIIKLFVKKELHVIAFKSGTGRKSVQGSKTTSYGAFQITNIEIMKTQLHEPGSSKWTLTYPSGYDRSMVNLGSDSLTAKTLLQVAEWAQLTPSETRWYCVGVLGFLLAPAAHSFREVAEIIDCNQIALFQPRYRYLGLLGRDLFKQPWFAKLQGAFKGWRLSGDLRLVCRYLYEAFPHQGLLDLILSFIDLPYLAPVAQSIESGDRSVKRLRL